MILNKDAFIKLRSKKQKACRLIKTDMNCHLNVFIWKTIFIYFGIFSQLTSRIAMSWTYLQTISTQCFPSSYFEEKTEASFQRDWTRVKISNLDGEKKNLSQFLHLTLESGQTKWHQMTKSSAEKIWAKSGRQLRTERLHKAGLGR